MSGDGADLDTIGYRYTDENFKRAMREMVETGADDIPEASKILAHHLRCSVPLATIMIRLMMQMELERDERS